MPPNQDMAGQQAVGSAPGCGQRLRAAREAAGLSLHDVAGRLKMPVRIVEALEAEDWTRIGAPVFVRGQLRSYSRLLGLPVQPVEAASGVAPIEPTRLVPRTHTPRMQRIADQVGGRLVYVVITALIILPVWVATQSHMAGVQEVAAPLDLPAGKVAAAHKPPAAAEPAAVVASMAALPPRQAAQAPALVLEFHGDSWMQVVAPDGHGVEEALLGPGDSRSYPAGEVGRIVLGNAAAVQVRSNGQVRDLAPYMRANVARFTVSSDGSLAPVSD
ncbi:MAG TPA: RodZ domain-containing protein [Luteimonas sp.]|nr:RodZ domain-containing protein [Luteimonas sp.]